MSRIKERLEKIFVLPFRFLQSHFRDCKRLRQKCKACGQSDGFNFCVPNEIWQVVVPDKYRNRVVCLKCFDEFACERKIDYRPFLSQLCFAGNKCLELEVVYRESRS